MKLVGLPFIESVIGITALFSQLKLLMEAIESRAKGKEYGQVLTDCHTLYCEQRLSLVFLRAQLYRILKVFLTSAYIYITL